MNLIHFPGLNCYHDCIVTIGAFLGLDYAASFATLWSETDFRYDQTHGVYLTKRMLTNFEILGLDLETLAVSSKAVAEQSLSLLEAGDWVIMGMDAFEIPWNPYYQTLHGPHYFLTQKQDAAIFSCFDPTYKKQDLVIGAETAAAHVFDLLRVRRLEGRPLDRGVSGEAREVLARHPRTRERLLEEIHACAGGQQEEGERLAKYIDALIHNRYLYRHYLGHLPAAGEYKSCFDDEFFRHWAAVKNGLYKASLIRDNGSVVQEVSRQLSDLLAAEMLTAEKMV